MDPLSYKLTADNLHIDDSYKIRKRKAMQTYLIYIYEYAVTHDDDYSIYKKRTIKSMIEEWRSHNLLYDLHLFRSRTKDVDINVPSKFWLFMYKVLSIFYIA